MTFSLANYQLPVITTKKINLNAIIRELLWFIKGDTNIKYLVKHGVNIWNPWAYDKFLKDKKKNPNYHFLSQKEFIQTLKNNQEFAKKYGSLGPIYGKQWRNFNGTDQLKILINNLKTDPFSRRHLVTSWNPPQLDQMALSPCHVLIQFYLSNNNILSCQLYQRSADMFLGIPFNITSYSLLTLMICHTLGYKPGKFIHVLGDAHIYVNHIKQMKEQIKRINETHHLPKLHLNSKIKSIFDFKFADIQIKGYKSHSALRGNVAV